MAKIDFEELKFFGDSPVRAIFWGRYEFLLQKAALERIGKYFVREGCLHFKGVREDSARRKLQLLISAGFLQLRHMLTNKSTLYIHEGLGLPLLGSTEFGICDRGSNIIEVKPLTGCNLNCVFCSVDEGKNDKRCDILIDDRYLLTEFQKLAAIKTHPIEANIGPHGEPLLYPPLIRLVEGIANTKNVKEVSINTNGVLLTKKRIDDLIKAGLTRINLSLHTLDSELANKMYGAPYPLSHVLNMLEYCKGKINVLLAPVVVPGFNEESLPKIILLGKSIESSAPTLGIQNFLNYKRGRNPVKQLSFEKFNELLAAWETKTGVSLRLQNEDFCIIADESLPKPFKKGQIIDVNAIAAGRYPREILCAAKERCLTIISDAKIGDVFRARITRSKHNIFFGIDTRL